MMNERLEEKKRRLENEISEAQRLLKSNISNTSIQRYMGSSPKSNALKAGLPISLTSVVMSKGFWNILQFLFPKQTKLLSWINELID